MTTSDPEKLLALDQVSSTVPFYLYWKNKRGIYLGSNDALANILGFTKSEEILHLSDYDLCWHQSAAIYQSNDEKVMQTKTPILIIESGKLFNGQESSAVSYKAPLLSRTNKMLGIIGFSFPMNTHSDFLKKSCSGFNELGHLQNREFIALTQRQRQCLGCLIKGMSTKKIAKELNLTPRTVDHYIAALKKRLNCRTRTELIAKAFLISSKK